MADPNFVYQKINLKRMEKTDKLKDFFVIYSRLLASYDFEDVKNDLIKLAKNNVYKALSLYLNLEKNDKIDKELILKAREIEAKVGEKTPEEWEVVASLHVNDRINVIIDNSINNTKELNFEMGRLWNRYDEYKNEYDHFRYVDPFDEIKYTKKDFEKLIMETLNKCRWLYKCMQGGEYSNAIKQAQIGFYERYFKYRDTYDLYSFLELDKQPLNFYRENNKLNEIDGGKLYSKYELAKFLKKDYKSIKKSSDIIDKFCVLKGIELIGGESGFIDWLRFANKIKTMIENISKENLSYVKTFESDNLNLKES